MIAVLQRVSRAEVRIAGREPAAIGPGLLILLGVARGDGEPEAEWLAKKCLSMRIFRDEHDHMNRSLADVGGEVLIVSQFTLLGNCIKGRRPSWSHAADPGEAEQLYERFVGHLRAGPFPVKTGVFQAMMEVESVNDGPVTLIIDTRDWKGGADAGAGRAAERILGLQHRPLVLASRSPRRARLLEMLGVRFEVREPEEDGRAWRAGEDPGEYALRQAEAKARSVAGKARQGTVLGADTVVYLDGEVLEKPRTSGEAGAYLRRLSGREHEVYTAISLVPAAGGAADPGWTSAGAVERSGVTMSALDDATIRDYVGMGEPLDKAGAYGIQGVGGMLVASIRGCFFNVMGLPLSRLRALMHTLEAES